MIAVKLALELMNNGHGPVAEWSIDECKYRTKQWEKKEITKIIRELTEQDKLLRLYLN